MKISVQGHDLYAYTGGKLFNPAQPTAVFIHGVLNDHSVWILQTRYLAHHGWNVLAIDLPGHCKSEGPPPDSVEQAAATVIALLDAMGIAKAALIGHSFGSLIALQAAAQAVAPGGWVYLEAPALWTDEQLAPWFLKVQRHMKAGAVHAHLLQKMT